MIMNSILLLFSLSGILSSSKFLYFLLFSEMLTFSLLFVFLKNQKKKYSKPDIIEFLLVSIISKVLFFTMFSYSFLSNLFYMGLLIKMGLLPFPWWSVKLSTSLNWIGFFFLNSFSKIPYLMFLQILPLKKSFFYLFLFVNLIYSMHQMFCSTTKIRLFLAWSSMLYMTIFLILGKMKNFNNSMGFLFYYMFFLFFFSYLSNHKENQNSMFISFVKFSGVPPMGAFLFKIFIFCSGKDTGISVVFVILAFFYIFSSFSYVLYFIKKEKFKMFLSNHLESLIVFWLISSLMLLFF